MKHILIAFLIAMGLGLIFTSKSQIGEPYIKLNDQEPLLFDSITSIFVKAKVEEISAKHQFVPLFFVFDGKLFFIKSKTDRVDDSMFVGNKFGIINQNGEVILEQKYDKIYNPNFTITNCSEIAQNGKVGLINLITNKIIEPQFEYIVPSGNTPSIAYGLKANDWYELNSETMQQTQAPNYSPEKFLSELNWDFTMNKTDYFIKKEDYLFDLDEYNSKTEKSDYEDMYANGVFLIPSFGQLFGNSVIFTDAVINEYDGIAEYSIKNQFTKKIQDFMFTVFHILKFVTGTRDGFYYNYSTLTIHKDNKLKYFEDIYTQNLRLVPNNSLKFRLIDDSLIAIETFSDFKGYEIDSNYKINNLHAYRYNMYYKIKNYKFESLETNRIFTITKFEKLTDSIIKGNYIVWDPPKKKPKLNEYEEEMYDEFNSNLYSYSHPSIKHLNLMKNEILADYGYIFKDKEWNEYFNKMKWYKPQHTDVSKFLTEIDKHNINYINKLIKKMKGKEKKFTKPKKYDYPIAG